MTAYIALMRKDPDSDYGVDFPDFPGCITVGDTMDDARLLAVEALQFHIAGMKEDGEAMPEPSTLEAVMSDPDNREGLAFLVDVATKPPKAIRINIMMPEDLVQAIDRTTTNRSRFLAEAAKAKLREAALSAAAE